MSISYDEYTNLVNTTKKTKKLTSGCYYYIEDLSRKNHKKREVYHGKYLRTDGKTNIFENVKYLVNPFHMVGIPFGFEKTGFRYIPDNSMPCDKDILNKNARVEDLNEAFHLLRSEPFNEGEVGVSFIGEDFRATKKHYDDGKMTKLKSSTRKSSVKKTPTKSSGGRKKTRRNKKKRNN